MASTEPPGKPVAAKESDGFVRAIARGFGVVEALGRPPGRHTLSETARLANVTRATARRILATLVAMRYCASDGRYFQLRPRALGLGLSYLSSLPFWANSHRTVESLRDETSESCALAVLDETGKLLEDAVVYPHGQKKNQAEARRKLHNVDVRWVEHALPEPLPFQARSFDLVVMVVVSALLLVVLFKFLRAVLRRLSSFFSGSAKVA